MNKFYKLLETITPDEYPKPNMPYVMSNKEIFNYINDLHIDGVSNEYYEDMEWINQHKHFELVKVKISSLLYNTANPPFYKDKDISTMPPPVVSHDYYVMDGNHRVNSIKYMGYKYIWIYKGVK